MYVFEWDMGHLSILRAHHHFGLGLSLQNCDLSVIKNMMLKIAKWLVSVWVLMHLINTCKNELALLFTLIATKAVLNQFFFAIIIKWPPNLGISRLYLCIRSI